MVGHLREEGKRRSVAGEKVLPRVLRSGGYAVTAPRFYEDAIASRVRRSERRGLLSSSEAEGLGTAWGARKPGHVVSF